MKAYYQTLTRQSITIYMLFSKFSSVTKNAFRQERKKEKVFPKVYLKLLQIVKNILSHLGTLKKTENYEQKNMYKCPVQTGKHQNGFSLKMYCTSSTFFSCSLALLVILFLVLFSLPSLLLHFDLCFLSLSPAVLFDSALCFV